jgi:hypothetical protein
MVEIEVANSVLTSAIAVCTVVEAIVPVGENPTIPAPELAESCDESSNESTLRAAPVVLLI